MNSREKKAEKEKLCRRYAKNVRLRLSEGLVRKRRPANKAEKHKMNNTLYKHIERMLTSRVRTALIVKDESEKSPQRGKGGLAPSKKSRLKAIKTHKRK